MARKRRKAIKRSKVRRDIGPAEALLRALNHPVRAQALTILTHRIASPREIADRLDQPLGIVSYHVRVLAELGLAEIVEEQPLRGAVEHFFRAVQHDRHDGGFVRTPLRMDEAGWAEVRRIQRRACEEILEEQAAADSRIDRSPDAATEGLFGQLLLEVPPEELGDAR
jgi:DNA-binding transcriptional ArsR family regulator